MIKIVPLASRGGKCRVYLGKVRKLRHPVLGVPGYGIRGRKLRLARSVVRRENDSRVDALEELKRSAPASRTWRALPPPVRRICVALQRVHRRFRPNGVDAVRAAESNVVVMQRAGTDKRC